MNSFDSLEERVVLSPIPRKRGRSKEYHDREKRRKLRYSGGGKVPQIRCTHTARNNAALCHADVITEADLAFNHAKFYENPDKVAQDALILSLLEISDPKRRRVLDEKARKAKDVSVKYTLLSEQQHPQKIKVCRKTFIKLLGKWGSFILHSNNNILNGVYRTGPPPNLAAGIFVYWTGP